MLEIIKNKLPELEKAIKFLLENESLKMFAKLDREYFL
ncbi:MAG TPA: hypothetical protein PLD27_08845 [bacterium]|nr:hypothetical protein [bacterium]HOL47236.1 hypothetical protein [bacterium]HPQ19272.1 hypothetical protein [bacterium]